MAKICFLLFLLSLFLLSATLSLAEGDKEENQRDPRQEYQQCQRRCQRQERDPRQQQQCQQRCEERFEEQREHRRGGDNELLNTRRQGGRYEEGEEEDNPYFFSERSLTTRFRSEEGRVSVLERFSDRSELLRGLDNYRLACLEANPNTFVLPTHLDAEAIFFVVKGRGTITLVRHDDRESFNLESGDVIRVPAGTTFYLVNRDNNEKLGIAKFLYTISTPGRFREYFAAGGQNPESYLRTFSDDILQAAFNTQREKIDRVFGKQREGLIVRTSHDQIRELTREASRSRRWHIGRGESRGPYNLFNKRPEFSNNYGQFYLVKPEDYRQLQEMDVSVCAANISQGAMMGPFFNSRSTKVVVVNGGSGYVEMACPHLSSRRRGGGGRQEEEKEGGHYEKVRAHLTERTGIIIPAGHPAVFVASENEDLQIFAFGINAQYNHENFLAGRERNVLQQIDRQAMELAFAAPGKQVEELVNSQDESIFFPGPRQRQRQPINSILDVDG